MADTQQAPARGGAKSIATQTPDQESKGREVTDGTLAVNPIATPKQSEQKSIVLEGLGDIFDTENPEFNVPTEEESEGQGEWMVVMVDIMTGANGVNYTKGDVRRLSKFVNGYGDKEKVSEVRNEVRRLFSAGAIRQATSSEKGQRKVEIGSGPANVEANREREERIRLEQENEALRLQLAQSEGVRQAGTMTRPEGTTGEGPTKGKGQTEVDF